LRPRLISLLVVIAALVIASAAFASTQASSVVKKPIKITVTLNEYSIKFSRASVPKGSIVIFTVKNAGKIAHNADFVGTGKRTPISGPGSSKTLKITFPKKGSVQVVCDVPRHIQLGMLTSFTVK
jgi:uncharacterized cupredoxin-like copper-binding protein